MRQGFKVRGWIEAGNDHTNTNTIRNINTNTNTIININTNTIKIMVRGWIEAGKWGRTHDGSSAHPSACNNFPQ